MDPFSAALLAGILVFAATLVAVPVVRRLSRGSGLYERPVADRWHRKPVAKLGGVGMAVVFLPVAWVLASTVPRGDHRDHLRALVLAPALLFLVGVVDDIWPLRAITKLIWQTVAAALFVWLTGSVAITGFTTLDAALSLVWFVGITNAFNLLDNIDGLAAGIAGIAATFVVAAVLLDGTQSLLVVAYVVSALAGVAFGFLVYNWHPASIFMGDGGSHLLGSVLAGATIIAATHLSDGRGLGTPMVIVLLLVPCADTLLVTLTRQMAGKSAFVGGRDHLSHRIVALGMPDSKAVLVLYGMAVAGGLVALGLQTLSATVGWMLVAAYGVLVAAVGVYLAHIETGGGSVSPLPGEIAARYRTSELLFDGMLIALAYYIGLATRFREPNQFAAFLQSLSSILPLVLSLHLLALWLAGRYRRPVASANADLMRIVRGGALGSGASVIAVLYLTGFRGYSRQAFAVAAVLVVLLLAGGHAALNALDDYLRRRKSRGPLALIYGAGTRGALVASEVAGNPEAGLTPAGFIDDDVGRSGERQGGLRVLGTLDDLDAILADAAGAITTIIVSLDPLPADRLEYLCAIAARHQVDVQQLSLRLDDVDTTPRRPASVVRFR